MIFPVMFEDVDFNASEQARGVKFVISGLNWTMCRPRVDDYNSAVSRLMRGVREKGRYYQHYYTLGMGEIDAVCKNGGRKPYHVIHSTAHMACHNLLTLTHKLSLTLNSQVIG